ncbi:MAG: F0F1 ATP synthase subunit B [Bacteroidales bacterium]|nr:F0F1 ATP synthase subunit B [Bacteroidales bacterium]
MELVLPGIGLIFWMTLSFLILVFILSKFAWKPIVNMLKKREDNIMQALEEANKTREEMELLKADNEILLKEAKNERDAILTEARKVSQNMYDIAKEKANEEAERIIVSAKETIHYEKMKAIAEIKNIIADFSIEIAEKIIVNELKDKQANTQYVHKLLDDIKLN